MMMATACGVDDDDEDVHGFLILPACSSSTVDGKYYTSDFVNFFDFEFSFFVHT